MPTAAHFQIPTLWPSIQTDLCSRHPQCARLPVFTGEPRRAQVATRWQTTRPTCSRSQTTMQMTKMSTSGEWSTGCGFGGTTRSCSTSTRLLHFGGTRSSAGQVRYSRLDLVHTRSCIRVDDPNDAFWLAQTYFMTNQYSRAERLLTRPFPTEPPKRQSSPVPPTNGHLSHLFPSAKGKGREQDLPQPTALAMPRLPMGPAGLIEVPEDMQERVSRLVDMSVACRYLAAQCQVCQFPPWAWSYNHTLSDSTGELDRGHGNARRGKSFQGFWSARLFLLRI
jgi:hypothetical protein